MMQTTIGEGQQRILETQVPYDFGNGTGDLVLVLQESRDLHRRTGLPAGFSAGLGEEAEVGHVPRALEGLSPALSCRICNTVKILC